MNRVELKTALAVMEISQVDLARLVDVTPRAVNLWMTGARGVPGPVGAYVDLLASLPLAVLKAELANLNKGSRTMKDGMYLIEFKGDDGIGFGTLIFEGGRVYGADVSGGSYDGEYLFNQDTDMIDVKIRVQMSAGSHSVVGISQPFDWILEVTTEIDPDKDVGQLRVNTNLGKSIVANYRFLRSLPSAA